MIASVNRPIIIGAHFLSKFGLLVDLKNKRLVDSQTKLTVSAITIQDNTPTPLNFCTNNEYGLILKKFPSLSATANFNHP